MSYFFTVAEDLKQDLALAQQVADQKNDEAHAVYKQRHDDWVRFHQGEMPQPPGTWVVTRYETTVNGVTYAWPNKDPGYQADQPLCLPLPVPVKPDISGTPGIGPPMSKSNPTGPRRVIGRVHPENAGDPGEIEVDGVVVKYRLVAYQLIANEMWGGYWVPVPKD